jgi:quinol monooxygenase YgiN
MSRRSREAGGVIDALAQREGRSFMTHVTIIGTVICKPETREELLSILTDQVAPSRAEPGCINYDFHADAENPCCFVFYENWHSQADLDAHLKQPHVKPLFSQIDRLLAEPVQIRYLNMISPMAGAG